MQIFLHDGLTPKPHSAAKDSVHPQTKYDPSSGRPIYGKFNTAHGCTMRNCKFAHVCCSCFKPHSDHTHKSQRTPSSMPTSHDQSPPLLKHLAAWEHWLADDFDRDFILHCVKYGASLIDPDKCPELIPPASVPNGRSVTTAAVYPLVTQQILNELANGNYIQCDTPPKIVSALSAIPKPDGNIRLIHDMSRPDGLSVNSYASKDPCKYQTIADALALIQPSWFMAVLDLKSAYRSVHIRDSEHCLTGLSWKFPGDSTPTFMLDSRLPFGSRKSPAIFNRLTQAVARIMRCKGDNIMV